MNSNQTPLARKTGIIVKKIDNEVLVYDTEHHQAHCLNQQAALIWENCDGNQTVKGFCSLLSVDGDVTERQKEQMVWIALGQLENARLLDGPIEKPAAVKGLTRRQLIKAAGIAALVAIPLISKMVAPTAAEASTCLADGQSCILSSECCNGVCDVDTCA